MTVDPHTTSQYNRYPPALRVVCPLCGARPAQPCVSRRRHTTGPHTVRFLDGERLAARDRHPSRTTT